MRSALATAVLLGHLTSLQRNLGVPLVHRRFVAPRFLVVFKALLLSQLLLDRSLVKLLACAGKNLLHVLASACAGLEALVDAVDFGELNGAVELHFALGLEFALVADEVDSHVLRRVLFDLLEPAAQVVEGLVTCDVVGKENAVRTSVEDASHRFEGLLAGLYKG